MASGVKVEGLRQTVRSLERFGVDVADLKAAFKRIGNMVVREAVSLTPTLTGRLAASIRASNTKNKSEVRAGSAKVVYAGVQHYGGYNNIEPHPFLTKAVDRNETKTVQVLEHELKSLIRSLGLDG